MSRWNWTVCFFAGPFVVLPLLFIGPVQPPSLTPRTAPAALDRMHAGDHDGDMAAKKASAAAEADWETASEVGTLPAYRDDLRRYPDGVHAAEARLRLEQTRVSPERPTGVAEADGSKPTPAIAPAVPDERAEMSPSLRPGSPAASAKPAALNQAGDAEAQPASVAAPTVESAQPTDRFVAHEALRPERRGRSKRSLRSAGPAKPNPGSTSVSLSYAPVVRRERTRGQRFQISSAGMRSSPRRFKLSELVERPPSAALALKSRATAVRKARQKVRPGREDISDRNGLAAGRKRDAGGSRHALQTKSGIRVQRHGLRRRPAGARHASTRR